MNYRPLVLGAVLLIISLPSTVLADTCQPTDPINTRCTLHVNELRPTQFAVGSVAVTCKQHKLSKKSKKKLKKYLAKEKRRIPVAIGPNGNFYMTDHHHLSTALYRTVSSTWGNERKILHVQILDNFRSKDTSWGEFWETMQKENRSYNYDNKGIPNMSFALLPTHVKGLLNDPYRTISRWVRESCGYVKDGKEQCDAIRPDPKHKAPYFMEFYWGDFFRQNLPLTIQNLEICQSIPYEKICLHNEVVQLKAIYDKSMKLAASEKAKKYFEDRGLNPWDYGYNPTGKYLQLKWSGNKNACEEPIIQ